MSQISLFDGAAPLKITKPIRLIECFAGYGSQALSLKYLGADFEHWKIAEWAVKSIQAYKDMHFPNDNTDYSAEHSKEWLIDYLYSKGISADYNKPMTREQISRMGEAKIRTVYNNIIATRNLVSVCNVKGEDLHITDTDKYTYVLTYSFPCQDLSNAGLGKGMEKGSGTRSGLLWEIERILEECRELPQILLMENVPEAMGAKNSKSFSNWFMKLESLGYKSWYKVMNAKDYEVPQNRERCFMVSALGDYYYDFPNPKPLKLRLKDMLEAEVDEKYYLSKRTIEACGCKHIIEPLEPKVLGGIGEKKSNGGTQWYQQDRIYDDNVAISVTTAFNPYYKVEQEEIRVFDAYNKREIGTDGLAPTVRTFCGGGQETKIAVNSATKSGYEIAEVGDSNDYRIRKLTPKECFRLMGVKDEDFERVANNQSNSSLYHLAGDSIVTNCLMEIFKEVFN